MVVGKISEKIGSLAFQGYPNAVMALGIRQALTNDHNPKSNVDIKRFMCTLKEELVQVAGMDKPKGIL